MAEQVQSLVRESGARVSMGSSTTITVGTGMFRALDIRFAPGLRLVRHHHDEPNFVVTRTGCFERSSSRRRLTLTPGTVFTEPAGEPHANEFASTGATVLIVQPLRRPADFSTLERRAFDTQSTFASYPAARLAAEIAREVQFGDAYTSLAIDGLVLQMLSVALRAGERVRACDRPGWLDQVVEIIHDEPAHRLSITALSKTTGIHPSHLARAFRAAYGVSLGRFARNVRLDAAAAALATTSQTISRIASDAGFADQSHFTRAFKRCRGMTPAQFRRQHRTSSLTQLAPVSRDLKTSR
jgi:AraC family transcriptional regulator